jgi:acyl transferase domain-containing protein/glutamate-1-semialdehyde aminotransferase
MSDSEMQGIAIVGMAGKFPGAPNINAFWKNLRNGVESITRFTPEEVVFKQIPNANEERVYARGVLEQAEFFDASFFGYNTRDAEYMDPQHRVFLETAWEALEHAGYDADRINKPVGVFAGCSMNTYLLYNLCSSRDFIEELIDNHQVGGHPALVGNDKDFLATRVAYKMGLKGPCVAVQSACSSSLVAVVLAWQSLMSYQCDMAMAGGVSISFPQNRSYPYMEGAMVSKDGCCRAFDADAQGMLYGGGAGIVVLKRIEDAVNDGDTIYSVILGAAINNDGSSKVSYMAPSIDGQAEAILTAQELAGVEPENISYIEAHGTGTPLGDPIEIAALSKAFQVHTQKKQFCAIGSVKTNIGHLETAAGVASLIKTVLSIHNKEIPASLHFKTPNPKIDFASSPFYVNDKLRPWDINSVRRTAGVSSFGVGGTNAHVVVQEQIEQPESGTSRSQQLLVLSAKTENALKQMASNLAGHLETNPDINFDDVSFTLQHGRKLLNCRKAIVASNAAEAIELLRKVGGEGKIKEQTPSVAFLFPGQGAQHINMARELFDHELVFREAVNECVSVFNKTLKTDLQRLIYPDKADAEGDESYLDQTGLAQPAIFTIEFALTQLWMSWGIKPSVMIGHSIGEYVAAVIAEVFKLEDAIMLLSARAKMMQALPKGAMIAVRSEVNDIQDILPDELSVAAVNAPKLCVVSGSYEKINEFKDVLEKRQITATVLHTSHAFHSQMMEPMLAEFGKIAKQTPWSTPKIPWISTFTGKFIQASDMEDGKYWASQIRNPVLFANAVSLALESKYRIYLEVGPGRTLYQLARQNISNTENTMVLASLAAVNRPEPDLISMLNTLGTLWTAGVEVNWDGFSGKEKRRRVSLPTYPFERKKFWVEPKISEGFANTQKNETISSILQTKELKMNVEQIGAAKSTTSARKEKLLNELRDLLKQFSGDDYSNADPAEDFIDMGFDSLFLTQFSQGVTQHFNIKITFRQMLEDLSSLNSLCDYIANGIPAEEPSLVKPAHSEPGQVQPSDSANPMNVTQITPVTLNPLPQSNSVPGSFLQSVIQQQVALMSQQLALLSGNNQLAAAAAPVILPVVAQPQQIQQAKSGTPLVTAVNMGKKATFGPFKKIEKGESGGLTDKQQKSLDELITRYNKRTAGSKAYAQKHRSYYCDPRAAGNYRQLWKEMVYPIVCKKSKGSRIWDIDGNEYIDITMGFGANYLGHSPDFVIEALKKQIELGIEIGPQSILAGEVAQMICEMTGMERVTFCNTGSEAVTAAFRVARTVTGRDKIVYFYGDYHGVFDEVLGGPAMADGHPSAMPIAPGIPHLANVMVLEYGNPVSLETISKYAYEIAGVIVEPVQSRHPGLQPREFLKDLRVLTKDKGIALIFDEVITGFRIAQGGAQEYFGVKADMATYGKVIGGGMPIGVLGGTAAYMDVLDGGYWQYGDTSSPPTGVTFFAGTFVRHPLAMAAAHASMKFLKSKGPALQKETNERISKFVVKMNNFFDSRQLPMRLEHFSSLFYYDFHSDLKYTNLLFYYMRDRGIHIFEGRGGFISIAHDDRDMEILFKAFQDSIDEMQIAGFLPPKTDSTNSSIENYQQMDANNPPVPGAKLGKDTDGNPAWFIKDPEREGKYLQLSKVEN